MLAIVVCCVAIDINMNRKISYFLSLCLFTPRTDGVRLFFHFYVTHHYSIFIFIVIKLTFINVRRMVCRESIFDFWRRRFEPSTGWFNNQPNRKQRSNHRNDSLHLKYEETIIKLYGKYTANVIQSTLRCDAKSQPKNRFIHWSMSSHIYRILISWLLILCRLIRILEFIGFIFSFCSFRSFVRARRNRMDEKSFIPIGRQFLKLNFDRFFYPRIKKYSDITDETDEAQSVKLNSIWI